MTRDGRGCVLRGAGCGLDAFLGAVESKPAPRVDPGARL